ncbi:dTDP-4-dehydrorhamnose reductase [Streptomyces pinistramenti]|uniref:dTDP-4-dehydrorhamnose reductase n=1 Tax=Streptomyces pinistramenti TaxID=2884812 RepID=UPI001D05C9F6|nr:dTDP-4-dehydrorhamnose reductase [Streptomyces pinistramenti]MCB5909147.1 dTDP-4-dehydrorhamnose reductase [Streptomyces pinistramenti]
MTGWLITGADGMLGREVTALLRRTGQPVLPLTRTDLDLTSPDAIRRALRCARPAVVVNCAAWTDVDGAESAEAAARAVNGDAVRTLARACGGVRARLLHLSTDYVFAGDAGTPYPEDAPAAPRTAYGRSKLAGEHAVRAELPHLGTVVRTAWLYAGHGRNFVTTAARKAAAGESMRVVDDQHGQPTWARDVAGRLLALGGLPADRAAGVFHATSAGRTTWYGLAREVFRLTGADGELVRPMPSTALQRPAPRPAFSVLGHARWDRAGLAPPRPWHTALAEALAAGTPSPAPSDSAADSAGAHRPASGRGARCAR